MNTETPKFTVLTMLFGTYDKIRPIAVKDLGATYICVTDRPDYIGRTVEGWTMLEDPVLTHCGWSGVNKAYYVKEHTFKYTTDDIVILMDASISIEGSCLPLINEFIKGNYDIALKKHPTNDAEDAPLFVEMAAVHRNGCPYKQLLTQLGYMGYKGYDLTQRNLIEGGFRVLRNTQITRDFQEETYNDILSSMAQDVLYSKVQWNRVHDQVLIGWLAHRYKDTRNMRIMPLSNLILTSPSFKLHCHGLDRLIPVKPEPKYFLNEIQPGFTL